MSTITLPNIRVSSDLTIRLKLKDGGVAIDWSTLQNIRVSLYADDQRSMASRCNVSIDEEDSTILVCQYAANKMQYLGVNRVIVQCKYLGEVKTYDKPAFTFVRWTSDQEGEQITIDDPDVDVEISVEDVSSSILQEAVDAAFSAADRANEAAEEAEHMVDIHTGPAGKSPYIGENGHWYEWDEETHQYVDTETNAKGDTGETPDISIGTVTTVEPGTPAAASMGGTPEAPVLNLSIPKGAVGATPNFTVGTVTTGQPGTPVVITITGTAEAPVLNVTIPQGLKGDTGVSADYPITIHNGLDSDATDEALAAAQGKILDGKVSQLEHKVNDLNNNVNGGFGLNPANILTDPTFGKGYWELQNGTVELTSVPDSLSKKAVVTRINTGSSAYYWLRLPVSLFEDGKTYRISVINGTASQVLATRTDNGSGFVGYILADVSMTTTNLGDGKYFHTYDWTVATSSFGAYQYVQIAFKFYDGFWFEEPFCGLSTGETAYALPETATVVKKTDVVDNLLSTSVSAPLSANQGRVLDEKIDTETASKVGKQLVTPVNKCPGDFYDNKYYGSGTGQIMTANNYACAKPFMLPAGNYLYIINKQMFGTGAGYAYIFSDPDDTTAASSVTATLLEERVVGGYTMGIYAVTIPTDSYVGFNVGLINDEASFMVVDGTTLSDWPSAYQPYFTPYYEIESGVKVSRDTEEEINPLLGKKLAVEGDSICQGAGMNGGYAKIIGENNEMSVQNNGVSGGTITYGTKYSNNTDRHWICTSVASLPSGFDYYILEGGVNDCGNQVTIGDLVAGYPQAGAGDTLDKETLIGAMEYMCRDLVTQFPGKKCGFIFVHGIFGNDSQLRVYWAEAKSKMISALKKWGVPFIDLESLVPPLNCIPSLKSVYTANGDGWHPNELGYNTFYVEKITEWMKTL